MSHKDHEIVEKTVDAAKVIGHEKAKGLLHGINNDSFDEIDTQYPEIMVEGQPTPPKEVVREKHQDYIDRIASINLTVSLLLALGYDVPPNHAFSLKTLKDIADGNDAIEIGEQKDGVYRPIVKDDDFHYMFMETNERLSYLRALHFLVTRHDPDMTEIINRQIIGKANLANAEYLRKADEATAARAASTPVSE